MIESVFYGSLPMRLEGDEVSSGAIGALDGGSVRYLCAWPGWETSLAGAGVARGSRFYGSGFSGSLWVKDLRVARGGGEGVAEVLLEGLLSGSGDKRLRSISAFGSIVSVGPIERMILVDDGVGEDQDGGTATAKRRVPKTDSAGDVVYKSISTPTGVSDRWNINDPGVSVVDSYFVTSEPSMTGVGQQLAGNGVGGLMLPTPPAYLWGTYTEPMRANHPAGWVLSDRRIEQLYGTMAGAGLYKVTDTMEYYQPAMPD